MNFPISCVSSNGHQCYAIGTGEKIKLIILKAIENGEHLNW